MVHSDPYLWKKEVKPSLYKPKKSLDSSTKKISLSSTISCSVHSCTILEALLPSFSLLNPLIKLPHLFNSLLQITQLNSSAFTVVKLVQSSTSFTNQCHSKFFSAHSHRLFQSLSLSLSLARFTVIYMHSVSTIRTSFFFLHFRILHIYSRSFGFTLRFTRLHLLPYSDSLIHNYLRSLFSSQLAATSMIANSSDFNSFKSQNTSIHFIHSTTQKLN